MDPGLLSTVDVVVFGTGAHYVDDKQFGSFLRAAKAFTSNIVKPAARTLFRTNAPGHGGCQHLSSPFRTLTAAEAYLREHPWFHGNHFSRQNAIARHIFGEMNVLDVYNATVLRGDAHIATRGSNSSSTPDCLHFCLPLIPGPVLMWIDLLFSRLFLFTG